MQVEKIFTFQDVHGEAKIEVKIPEIVDPKYGMFTWPSAPVLAQFIWHNREQVKGKHVVEIGAGTSLPGMVAALNGASVILTDKEEYPECLENCQKTCKANELYSVEVLGITWGHFSPNLLNLPKVDFILGSDCFYDTKDFDDILATVSYLTEKNTKAKFWTTYQERSCSYSIENLLRKWGLEAIHIPLEQFSADQGNIGGNRLSDLHTIHMLEITRQQDPSDV